MAKAPALSPSSTRSTHLQKDVLILHSQGATVDGASEGCCGGLSGAVVDQAGEIPTTCRRQEQPGHVDPTEGSGDVGSVRPPGLLLLCNASTLTWSGASHFKGPHLPGCLSAQRGQGLLKISLAPREGVRACQRAISTGRGNQTVQEPQ